LRHGVYTKSTVLEWVITYNTGKVNSEQRPAVLCIKHHKMPTA